MMEEETGMEVGGELEDQEGKGEKLVRVVMVERSEKGKEMAKKARR